MGTLIASAGAPGSNTLADFHLKRFPRLSGHALSPLAEASDQSTMDPAWTRYGNCGPKRLFKKKKGNSYTVFNNGEPAAESSLWIYVSVSACLLSSISAS